MLLTKCAACAAPLAHNAPRCIRCHTRYCDATCQHDHWRRGHKQICKKIHRGGNAEQYYADKKYKEAVAVAVEACADDTKGQKCYICLEAVHPRTGEGLVRGCACGDRDGVSSPELGVAHVSCLAEQAKLGVAEAEENNLGFGTLKTRFDRWYTCSLCGQDYHGDVWCALGWACWKTYCGRPEGESIPHLAKTMLGNALGEVGRDAEALEIFEGHLKMIQRLHPTDISNIVQLQNNIANRYATDEVGRHEEALELRRKIYPAFKLMLPPGHVDTMGAAGNLAGSCIKLRHYAEARSVLREAIPVAKSVLGRDHHGTMGLHKYLAKAIRRDEASSRRALEEAITILEDVERRARRVFGIHHPSTLDAQLDLKSTRRVMRAKFADYTAGADDSDVDSVDSY